MVLCTLSCARCIERKSVLEASRGAIFEALRPGGGNISERNTGWPLGPIRVWFLASVKNFLFEWARWVDKTIKSRKSSKICASAFPGGTLDFFQRCSEVTGKMTKEAWNRTVSFFERNIFLPNALDPEEKTLSR